MSNLFTYLMSFDDADASGSDTAADDRTAQLLGDELTDDADVTLDLQMDERADFYATLNAIQAARIAAEIDEAWQEHEANADGG